MQAKSKGLKGFRNCFSMSEQKSNRSQKCSNNGNQVIGNLSGETSNQQSQNKKFHPNQLNNQEYYVNHNKNEPKRVKQDGISELSLLIYQGLDKARKQVQNQRLISKIQTTYKKQLQLQIQLTKELQKLTRCAIIFTSSNEVQIKISQLQEQIAVLKKQTYDIQNKMNLQNLELNCSNLQNGIMDQGSQIFYTSTGKSSKYNIINNNQKDKFKFKRNEIQVQQNKKQSKSEADLLTKLSGRSNNKKNNKVFEPDNQSFSPSPSRVASLITAKKVFTCSTSLNTNKREEQKLLLLQRRNIIKDQVELSEYNITKKIDMITCQIEILKKQLELVDEALEGYESTNFNINSKGCENENEYQLYVSDTLVQRTSNLNKKSSIIGDQRSKLQQKEKNLQINIVYQNFNQINRNNRKNLSPSQNPFCNFNQNSNKGRNPRFRSEHKQSIKRSPQYKEFKQREKHKNRVNNFYHKNGVQKYCSTSKSKKPSLFLRARISNNSPLLTRCRSENKFLSQLTQLQNGQYNNLCTQNKDGLFKSKSNMFGSGNETGRVKNNVNVSNQNSSHEKSNEYFDNNPNHMLANVYSSSRMNNQYQNAGYFLNSNIYSNINNS